MVWQKAYRRLLAPRSHNEDTRRRELILNVLLVGILLLSSVMLLITTINNFAQGSEYGGVSPLVILGVIGLFLGLYGMSRSGFHRLAAYIFIALILTFATWPLVKWSVLLPQGILMYGLVIVMAGVLLSSRMAFYIVLLMFLILLTIIHLNEVGSVVPNMVWIEHPAGYIDVIVYCFTFSIIALVAWLSNREIKRSLRRAQASERALLKERRLLETKVRQRTQELEKAQVEKLMDLQRFAEFGRLSSTLLHELANPLMSVSMNLEQLESKNRSEILVHAREGIAHMEQYVETARRQLRNQSEIKLFNLADEIRRVGSFLEPKAAAQRVTLQFNLVSDIEMRGDSVRFNHIVSNLMTNAVDAYEGIAGDTPRIVKISMQHIDKAVEITVCDQGQGIEEAQLEHLFEPFYTTKQVNHGTGLGLAIVKQAVEEVFEGSITAAHSKQKGTCFTVRLPLV